MSAHRAPCVFRSHITCLSRPGSERNSMQLVASKSCARTGSCPGQSAGNVNPRVSLSSLILGFYEQGDIMLDRGMSGFGSVTPQCVSCIIYEKPKPRRTGTSGVLVINERRCILELICPRWRMRFEIFSMSRSPSISSKVLITTMRLILVLLLFSDSDLDIRPSNWSETAL